MAETEDCEGTRVSDLGRFFGTGQNTKKEAAIFIITAQDKLEEGVT